MGTAKTSPSTDNYMIGKGVLWIAPYATATPSWVDVGNCPKFEFEPTEEELEHFSSRSGTKELDESIILQVGYNLNFTLDEISVANMQKFLKATLTGVNVLKGNKELANRYCVKFVADNPKGPNATYEFWKVKLTPQGAMSLIGDEFATLNFTGKGFKDATRTGQEFFTVTFATTTSTTTTTTTTTAP